MKYVEITIPKPRFISIFNKMSVFKNVIGF